MDDLPNEIPTGHSSKGNQLKWKKDGFWYKADHMGYEGLAETAVSGILQFSSLKSAVFYEPALIVYKNKQMTGCCSRDFLKRGEELITLEKLYRQYTGLSLAKMLGGLSDVKNRISFTVEQIVNFTGLTEFGGYLTGMLELDAFFLNEDRHTNNIAVIYDNEKKQFRLCPYFDMGLSMLSDLKGDFPLTMNTQDCLKKVKAKPFSADFDEQLDAAEELFGTHLKFHISANSMAAAYRDMLPVWEGHYERLIQKRVEEILCLQSRKYSYMLQNKTI